MKDSFPAILAGAAAVLAYVSAPGQRWLRAPWPARPTRSAAGACLLAALACGMRALHPATALALIVTVVMTCLTASPFIGVLVERVRMGAVRRGA
jgi:hypothetical protein